MLGNFLVVQWLGLLNFTTKGLGWILDQGIRIPQVWQCMAIKIKNK